MMPSYVELYNQWYFYSNDYSHQDATRGGFRNSIAAFVHYNDDGTIAPVTINTRVWARRHYRGRYHPR